MNREEMIRRLAAGEDPLELSIESWKDRQADGYTFHISDDEPCPLCNTNEHCGSCVIYTNSISESGCKGTPVHDYWENPTKYNAGRMVMFLKSLREE